MEAAMARPVMMAAAQAVFGSDQVVYGVQRSVAVSDVSSSEDNIIYIGGEERLGRAVINELR
jgi:hypothetical protein